MGEPYARSRSHHERSAHPIPDASPRAPRRHRAPDNRASTAELARATDLAPATALRLLVTLEDAGFASAARRLARRPEVGRLATARRSAPRARPSRPARPREARRLRRGERDARRAPSRPRGRGHRSGRRRPTTWHHQLGRSLHRAARLRRRKLLLAELDAAPSTPGYPSAPPPFDTADARKSRQPGQRTRARPCPRVVRDRRGIRPGLASIAVGSGTTETLVAMIGVSGPANASTDTRSSLHDRCRRRLAACRLDLRGARRHAGVRGIRWRTRARQRAAGARPAGPGIGQEADRRDPAKPARNPLV